MLTQAEVHAMWRRAYEGGGTTIHTNLSLAVQFAALALMDEVTLYDRMRHADYSRQQLASYRSKTNE